MVSHFGYKNLAKVTQNKAPKNLHPKLEIDQERLTKKSDNR